MHDAHRRLVPLLLLRRGRLGALLLLRHPGFVLLIGLLRLRVRLSLQRRLLSIMLL